MPENKGNILIIDDEPFAAATVEALLKTSGYRMLKAQSGDEGLALAVEHQPDVILLDVMMPGMDGLEVCRRLKSSDHTAYIPVLLITSLSERRERLKGIEAGANDYLTKPLDAQDLRLRVRNAIYTRKLYQQLQQSFEKLKKLEELRDNLTNMIVHDMRSSLTGISGFVELLKMSASAKFTPHEADMVVKINRTTKQLTDMVISLLDISRLESGQMPLTHNPCGLYDLAMSATQPLEALLEQRELVVNQPEAPATVVCDLDLVRRVIANLVSNAVKYTEPNGRIAVNIADAGADYKFSVTDDGPGIPAALHDRIFEKFGQTKREHRFKGVGLGLTFCKLAIQANGGSIGLVSEEGKGSTFWFTLPKPILPASL